MGYAIAVALVVLVIAALITTLVMRSARKGSPDASDGTGGPGIGADDESPLADTNQHAGQQDGGETVDGADARHFGGAGHRSGQGYTGTDRVGHDRQDKELAAHIQRPGEGEGANSF